MLIDPALFSVPVQQQVDASRRLRNLAISALWLEVITYPKPGLVSLVDNGSHRDMSASTFLRSAMSLRFFFEAAASAGMIGCTFSTLQRLGMAAETRMLRTTSGVNTHRGAIFSLGLLAAAAGWHLAKNAAAPETAIGEIVRERWGEELALHQRVPHSNGSRVSARHGTGGALAEALAGFPSVFFVALPAYRSVLAAGGSSNQARVQAFFALLAQLNDTNLLHRGGAAGLAYSRNAAATFLGNGGVLSPEWRKSAIAVHQECCKRGLSPGGSADLLAACVFIHSLKG